MRTGDEQKLPDRNYYNVSCENVGYKPISQQEIMEAFDE